MLVDRLAEQVVGRREVDLARIPAAKAQIVRQLVGDQPGRSLLIGDGLSDLLAGGEVDLFVGFGGVVHRPRVAAEAPCFISSASLGPLLVLAAGPAVLPALRDTNYAALTTKTRLLVETGAITFTDERLNTKFRQAYQAVYPGPY